MKFHSFATYLSAFEDTFPSLKVCKCWVCILVRGPRGKKRKVEDSKVVPIPCSVNKTVVLGQPILLLLLPSPCRGLLRRGLLIYRTLVCEWQKFLGISICLLITFQIMCCSLLWLAQKQFATVMWVCLGYFFSPLLVHWKQHRGGEGGGEQMRECFCVYTLPQTGI